MRVVVCCSRMSIIFTEIALYLQSLAGLPGNSLFPHLFLHKTLLFFVSLLGFIIHSTAKAVKACSVQFTSAQLLQWKYPRATLACLTAILPFTLSSVSNFLC